MFKAAPESGPGRAWLGSLTVASLLPSRVRVPWTGRPTFPGELVDDRLPYAKQGWVDPDAEELDVMGKLGALFGKKK